MSLDILGQSNLDTLYRVLQVLHMMIIEWVLHWPAFPADGLSLCEALEFYSESVGVEWSETEILPEHFKIEQSIAFWNQLVLMILS